MAGLAWQTLVQVREASQRRAQQQVSRDRETVDFTERQLLVAQGDWLESRQAGIRHRRALQQAADEGAATVSSLRQAGHWDEALKQRLTRAAHAVHEAEGVNAQAQRPLDSSRAELHRASAQVEKARHVDAESRRAHARARERRSDEQADEAALQRCGMPRRA